MRNGFTITPMHQLLLEELSNLLFNHTPNTLQHASAIPIKQCTQPPVTGVEHFKPKAKHRSAAQQNANHGRCTHTL